MLKTISRILGFIGSVFSLGESLLFTLISTFAVFSPDGSHNLAEILILNGFAIGILLIFFLACGLIGSLNVRKSPLISGAAMAVSGVIMFIFISLLLPDTLWPGKLPPLLLIAAGALAFLSYKKTSAGNGNQNPNSSG